MTTLAQKTYTLLKTVPAGRVTTYKALAQALHTKAYRAIGQFMRNNPYAPAVPCHRVVAADGTIGGFRGATSGKEIADKIALLAKEGVRVKNRRVIAFREKYYAFE